MTSGALLLRGGRLVDPSQGLDEIGDLLITNGVVEAIGRIGDVRRDGDALDTIDVAGHVVAPGFIDVHCHLREPGREEVETIATGARAAAAGGFTAVCAMPNTDPVTDNQAAVGFIISQAKRAGGSKVYPIGAISIGQMGQTLAEFGEMIGAGAVAVSDDGKPVVSAQLMRTALEYARTFGIPVADHCEEPTLALGGAMNEGLMSARLGLRGIPAEAEEIMAIRDILLARRTGGHIHLCHMSTKGSVELIRWGKERGINVTAEVCPHHLSLTEESVDGYNTNAKMNPPLRTQRDVDALVAALKDGTIDCVATDHAPHARDEKEVPFEQAPMGTTGLETAFAALHTGLVLGGVLELSLLVERMTAAAALFDLPIARIAVGEPANVTLMDLDAEWVAGEHGWESRSENCCFSGRRLRGRVLLTVASGAVVYRERAFSVVAA